MKKLLLIGLILAILLLAMPQGVMADTAAVNANIVPVSSFSALYTPSATWDLTQGTTDTSDVPIAIAVTSNQGWDVNAWDAMGGSKPGTAGHMYEWIASPPGYKASGEELDTALTIQKEDLTYASLGAVAAKVKIADGEATAAPFSQNSNLQQTTATGEKSLLSNTYRIVITCDITYR